MVMAPVQIFERHFHRTEGSSHEYTTGVLLVLNEHGNGGIGQEEQIAEAEAEVALAAGPPLPKRPVVCPGASPDRLQRSSKRSAKDGRGRWSAAFAVKRGCGDPRQCASFMLISPCLHFESCVCACCVL
mgnify:CR=1 FL=1